MDSNSQRIEDITPESLFRAILQPAAQHAPDIRFSVGVSVIVGRLIAGYDLQWFGLQTGLRSLSYRRSGRY
ncbi:MAG: hypothetical protein ACYCZF_04390 [Anaerolineae bacterium]